MPITQEDFGHTKDGRLVVKYSLSNKNRVVVKIINFGASITSIEVPDKAGNIADVILGYDKLDGKNQNVLLLSADVFFLGGGQLPLVFTVFQN